MALFFPSFGVSAVMAHKSAAPIVRQKFHENFTKMTESNNFITIIDQ